MPVLWQVPLPASSDLLLSRVIPMALLSTRTPYLNLSMHQLVSMILTSGRLCSLVGQLCWSLKGSELHLSLSEPSLHFTEHPNSYRGYLRHQISATRDSTCDRYLSSTSANCWGSSCHSAGSFSLNRPADFLGPMHLCFSVVLVWWHRRMCFASSFLFLLPAPQQYASCWPRIWWFGSVFWVEAFCPSFQSDQLPWHCCQRLGPLGQLQQPLQPPHSAAILSHAVSLQFCIFWCPRVVSSLFS